MLPPFCRSQLRFHPYEKEGLNKLRQRRTGNLELVQEVFLFWFIFQDLVLIQFCSYKIDKIMNALKIVFLGAKVLLGTLMIIFGLNKFLGFIPVEPPADATAQAFLGTIFTTYLYKVVALAEIIGGLLLFVPRFSFIGTLVLLPVVFNIIAFHIAHDMPGNGIWLGPTLLFMIVLISFKNKYHLMLGNKA